ncbi:permease [Curtobacterium flaccumfaciens]|nr:permease [Curtobacterium flaccumfaciens]
MQDFLTLAISVVVESLPFVVLGIVLSIVVEVWVPVGALEKVLPQNAFGRRAVISLIGMLFPVCECGNVPLARGLMMRGFTPAEAVTFLVAAPILNPLVIISTAQAFGWSGWILPVRIVGGFVVANLVGWIVAAHRRPADLLLPAFEARCRAAVGAPLGPAPLAAERRAVRRRDGDDDAGTVRRCRAGRRDPGRCAPPRPWSRSA